MINLAKYLTLTRPLAVFDIEATGPHADRDRIVQISIRSHFPDKEPVLWTSLVNPGEPIPSEAIAVHKITNEMVASAPRFESLAKTLYDRVFTQMDCCGHSARAFDVKILAAEFKRVGIAWDGMSAVVVDTLRLRQITRPNTLSAVYEEVTGEKLIDAHDAEVDVGAAEVILSRLLEMHPELPRDPAALFALCFPPEDRPDPMGKKLSWRNGEACMGFGKHGGKLLSDMVRDTVGRECGRNYLHWILKKDFPEDTKLVIRRALSGETVRREGSEGEPSEPLEDSAPEETTLF